LGGEGYRSFRIPEKLAGIEGYSLLLEETVGAMSLYRGRYRSRACDCQELPSVREGALLVKEGKERVHLVKKNRWLDRIKNAEGIASAFLPYDGIMKDVRDRQYDFSGIGKAVDRYNERSKASQEK
jgi:hypothetical protein